MCVYVVTSPFNIAAPSNLPLLKRDLPVTIGVQLHQKSVRLAGWQAGALFGQVGGELCELNGARAVGVNLVEDALGLCARPT